MTQSQVEYIKCNGCATSIKNSLLKLNGIESVTVNIDQEIMHYESTAKRDEIFNR